MVMRVRRRLAAVVQAGDRVPSLHIFAPAARQVMSIMEDVLDSWVHKVLLSFLPRDMLSLALRKLLFYEEASTYSAEPLVLETQERQGIKVLQSQMAVTEKSLRSHCPWAVATLLYSSRRSSCSSSSSIP
jgi:hypothetical protein